jgi:Uma2 family endonuclease
LQTEKLGRVYTPRAVVRTDESAVEPDLMVRPATPRLPLTWAEMPAPLLVVEIFSRTTHRRDELQRRAFSQRIGVGEYWMVDRWSRTIRVVRGEGADVFAESALEWSPSGAREALRIDVAAYFDEALGPRSFVGDEGFRARHAHSGRAAVQRQPGIAPRPSGTSRAW